MLNNIVFKEDNSIKDININSEESVDSNYSEEINADEIKEFESELLSKG